MNYLLILIILAMIIPLLRQVFRIYRKIKIFDYRFFLKILRDTKNDKNLDEKLFRMFILLGNFKKNFFLYNSRKKIRESKLHQKKLMELHRKIWKKLKNYNNN
jgi:hypothetical protein